MNPFIFQQFKKPYQSLFIEASAGTGKTYTIQLMVSRLISEGTPLKKILIVTYTEKAAGELKDRIRKKIDEVLAKNRLDSKEPELDETQRGYFRRAYQEVDNAAIFTIHSFCQKVLKEFAYDAGRPFDMSMVNDGDVENELERIIRDEWGKRADFNALINAADSVSSFLNSLKAKIKKSVDIYKGVDSKGNDIVKLEIGEFVWNDDSISAKTALSMNEGIDYKKLLQFKTFAKNLQTLRKSEIKKYTAKVERTVNKQKTIVPEEFTVDNLISLIEAWDSTAKNPFTPAKVGGALIEVPDNESSEALQYVFNFAINLKNLAPKIKDFCEAKSQEFKFYIDATREVFNKWQKYKSENKLQSFNDMILFVHKTLMSDNSTSLKSRLREQYRYAIIDEFQDTNQLQWDIFSSIFLNKKSQEGIEQRIFVVGDPKQSIYSFQGADVNVYQKAIHEIGDGCLLKHNYRSTDGIIVGCNALFEGDFFNPAKNANSSITFQKSFPPDDINQRKLAPTINGNSVASIWITDKVNPEDFAEMAVNQIAEWCSFTGDKTKLQVFNKDTGKLRNVSFKDFAILARARTEMTFFEDAMRRIGMPFTRYKENSLFKSRECSEWIAIFNALNAPDFSYWNRRLLNEALVTDFFNLETKGLQKLHYIESEIFDNPDNECRKMIYEWRALALKFRYAEMLERIYKDSKIEEKLMQVSKLQSLARLRQIGNYAIDYRYKHKCSLDDLVRHLEGLALYNESTDDENGDLVELASDFDAVQVMTIHASKGLEFPVVISAAGFKHHYQDSDEPVIYHQGNDVCIGFGEFAKAARKSEELEEWKRLFYVDFTRAASILILPQYDKWTEKDKNDCLKYPEYQFLQKAISDFRKNYKDKCLEQTSIRYYDTLPPIESFDTRKLTECITTILVTQKKIAEELEKANGNATQESSICTVEGAKEQMSSLQKALPGKAILQYSYSSLSGRVDSPIAEADNSRTDKEGEALPETAQDFASELQGTIDGDVISNVTEDILEDFAESPRRLSPEEEGYPRGSKVGDTLHNILEHTVFSKFGADFKTLDDALGKTPGINTSELANAIEEEFKAQSLPIATHKDEWIAVTTRFVWNTLNAELPAIEGNRICTATFKLTSIPKTDHKPEVQFGLNADNIGAEAEKILHRMCKGFIDLLFVRTDSEGNKRYSILDWKSDTLEVYAPAKIKAKVDSEYSVQRVLYSYCLIQWLKQFYGNRKTETGIVKGLDEQQIFDKHFGGIYYAFLRGTDGKTSSGIYAQTWKNFATLEKAYKNVKSLMTASKKAEGK